MSLRVLQVPGFFSTTGEPVSGTDEEHISDAWKPYDDVSQITIIFSTMYIGMGEITEKNIQEFAERMTMFEFIGGPVRRDNGEPVYWTLTELRDYIGLRTNVKTITAFQWSKVLMKMVKEFAEKRIKELDKPKAKEMPSLRDLASWFDPDMPEYMRLLDNGHCLFIEKAGGGTLGKAYSGEWWFVILDKDNNVIDYSKDFQTGTPKDHGQVADMIIEFREAEKEL